MYRFNVEKFPTIKYMRKGQMGRREYKGSRTVEGFLKFVQEKLACGTAVITEDEEIQKIRVRLSFIGVLCVPLTAV